MFLHPEGQITCLVVERRTRRFVRPTVVHSVFRVTVTEWRILKRTHHRYIYICVNTVLPVCMVDIIRKRTHNLFNTSLTFAIFLQPYPHSLASSLMWFWLLFGFIIGCLAHELLNARPVQRRCGDGGIPLQPLGSGVRCVFVESGESETEEIHIPWR